LPEDPLEELISSATPPLRFLRDAPETQRLRVRVPVQGWIDRLAGLGGEGEAGTGARVVELGRLFRELAAASPERLAELAGRALELLAELERSRSALAPSPRVGATADPEATADASGAALAAVEAWLLACASPLTAVAGVGPARAAELERFGLRSVDDLLYHLPFRYDDRREIVRTADLRAGESATIELEIRRIDERRIGRGGRRTLLSAIAGDESGAIELVWYNQIRWFRGRLKPGSRWIVHGKVDRGYDFALRIVHPELESAEEADAALGRTQILPVYEKPTAMPASAIRRIARAAVDAFAPLAPDVLPPAVRSEARLMPLAQALQTVHRPPADVDLGALATARSAAHRSIVFDELFFVQLGLLLRKAEIAREKGVAFEGPGELAARMISALPFPLTGAQRRVIEEIGVDQRAPHPMHRLLQGDVGSGKTVVAVAAALRAIECGWQAAIMAPTELLAEQHWDTVQRVAGGLGAQLWRLTGDVGAADRRTILPRLAAGEPCLVVGTHALIQEEVQLARLGLAIVDEQHRFGVLQRAALTRRSGADASPDVLLMTATPIPRTLALSVYGDLDLSYIDELPPGRQPVVTRIHGVSQRRRAYDLVRREIAAGRQAYVVYPLIEESEASDLRDATSGLAELEQEVLPGLRIALVHGRMPSAEREATMRAFKAGAYDVLVATTVIEVGIDVPNASVIVIEHAERFGLAQLHQLRGRVGRGRDAAYCVLVADWAQSTEARERLRVMTETRDGLRIAEADLAIRGPGAMLGTRQAGLPDFRVANLLRDVGILREARSAAEAVLARDGGLSRPESAVLARVLEARWAGRLGLARVG
jgi:ATP-dependent DNA helicase RecG